MAAGCGHACAISGAVMHDGYTYANGNGFHATRVLATGAVYRSGCSLFRIMTNTLPGAPPNRLGVFGFFGY